MTNYKQKLLIRYVYIRRTKTIILKKTVESIVAGTAHAYPWTVVGFFFCDTSTVTIYGSVMAAHGVSFESSSSIDERKSEKRQARQEALGKV